MKNGWEIRRLEEVCTQITDGSHFSPSTTDTGYPYITVRDINNDKINFSTCKFISTTDYRLLSKNGCKPNYGDLLFSKDGTVGKVTLVDFDKEIVVLSSLAIIRPDNKRINPTFLKYVLKSPAFFDEAVGKKTGAAIRRIILRNLKSIPVPLPPLPEQQRLVTILDEAFEGIAKAKANAEKNLQNTRALFENYLNDVFTRQGEQLEQMILRNVCEFDKKQNSQRGLPYVGLEDIESNTARFIGSHKVKMMKSSTFRFSNNHILFGRLRPYLNKVMAPDFEGHCSTEIFPLKPFSSIKREYLLYWFLSRNTVDNINDTCTGTRMPRANMEAVLDFTLPIPPLVQQKYIVTSLDKLKTETKHLESIYQKKLAALEELKKALLHQAFCGEL